MRIPDDAGVFCQWRASVWQQMALVSRGHWWMFRRRKADVEFAFLVTLLMWWFHFKVLRMFTPRYLAQSTTSRVCPWMLYGCATHFLLLVTCKTWHFFGWNSINQLPSHCCKASRSCWSLIASCSPLTLRHRAQSSANKRTVDPSETQSGRSIIYKRKSYGSSTLP